MIPIVKRNSPPKCAIPLYSPANKIDFRHLGTATLFGHKGAPFVVTASHVLAQGQKWGGILMPGKDGLEELPERWIRTPRSDVSRPEDDRFDIAVTGISASQAIALCDLGFGFISEEFVGDGQITRVDEVVFSGFEADKQILDQSEEIALIRMVPVTIATRTVSDILVDGLGYSPDDHILCERRDAYLLSHSGVWPVPPLTISGMSGGPVFRFEGNTAREFLGITTRYVLDEGPLIATKAKYILAALDHFISVSPIECVDFTCVAVENLERDGSASNLRDPEQKYAAALAIIQSWLRADLIHGVQCKPAVAALQQLTHDRSRNRQLLELFPLTFKWQLKVYRDGDLLGVVTGQAPSAASLLDCYIGETITQVRKFGSSICVMLAITS